MFLERTWQYWCGRTYPDYYAFELELPISTVIEEMAYVTRAKCVPELHRDSMFEDKFELPFCKWVKDNFFSADNVSGK